MMNGLSFDFGALAGNLQSNIKTAQKQTYADDTRFWKLSKDENGNGAAIIRLIPDKDLVPYIRRFKYVLKKPNPAIQGKYCWYFADSPDTIGLPDPVKEHYMALIEERTEEAKLEAKNFSRNTNFMANIIVVKDPQCPENNGKIFLWELGPKLMEKFNGWLQPSESEIDLGAEPKNIFHPVNGYNITLKFKKGPQGGSYDDTSVAPNASAIDESVIDEESAFEFIKANTYQLGEFLKPEAFESYEELKTKFEKYLAMGNSGAVKSAPAKAQPKVEDFDSDLLDEEPVAKPAPKPTVTAAKPATSTADEDDWLNELDD
jgi:hypothetical protein